MPAGMITSTLGKEAVVRAARRPQPICLGGRWIRLEPLDPAIHASHLWEALRGSSNDGLWDYLAEGPFADYAGFQSCVASKANAADLVAYAIVDQHSSKPVGMAALMRIEPDDRVIEVGHVLYSPRLQKTRGATEAMYLLARHVFEELGYRRYEWKCNALNTGSRRAAERLGFTFEGIFRQHKIVKGRNRDTAWFSMLDGEWPERRKALEAWLAPRNFDDQGRQKESLNPGNTGS